MKKLALIFLILGPIMALACEGGKKDKTTEIQATQENTISVVKTSTVDE